ncbi:MAG TPA: glutathione-disulfide reductase [Burkholderiales bacterium]|nr:glutathione-disulfide reductase [Burkholderiales bacterium]
MSTYDYDLFVIGAGSGGVRASRIAASFGARVAVAEHHRAGGTCVIRGCVPKKLLVYASHFREDFEDAHGYGWTVAEPSFSWRALIDKKNVEIARLERVYEGLLEKAGAKFLRGTARVVGPNAVELDGERITARYILVATGGWPYKPNVSGVEHCITSNEVFELPEQPRRVLVVGGGYIAVEFAGIFRGLGSEVTLSYRGDRILRGFDEDVRAHVQEEMAKKGVRFLLRSVVAGVQRDVRGALVARFVEGHAPIEVDAVLSATGRLPSTRGLGLEEAGVALGENGEVVVDRFSASSVSSIYAVGDVTDRIALTPVAIKEGHAVALTLFGNQPTPVDHMDVPSAVFCQPPVGTVGFTEAEATERFHELEIYKSTFRPLKHTLSGRDERTMMKLIVDRASQRVVGAHIVGMDAPEIVQGIGIAVKAGLTKAQFDTTVGIHPTAAEELVTMRDKMIVAGRGRVATKASV